MSLLLHNLFLRFKHWRFYLLISLFSEYSAGLGGGVFIFIDNPLEVLRSYSLTSAAYLSSVKYQTYKCQQK